MVLVFGPAAAVVCLITGRCCLSEVLAACCFARTLRLVHPASPSMAASVTFPLSRYSPPQTTTTHILHCSPHFQQHTDQHFDAQMGRKKSAKKLAAQQQGALTGQPHPMTTTAPNNEAAQPANQGPGGGMSKGQKKKARKQRSKAQADHHQAFTAPPRTAANAAPAFIPAQLEAAQQDATAYFSPGHGHSGEDHMGQGNFVGQGLLDALDTIQQPSRGEAQPGGGAAGTGRRTSLASRPAPAASARGGPPPSAPTGPRSQVKQTRPHPGPPPVAPFPPDAWTSGAAGPPPVAALSSQAVAFTPQQENPWGYNLQNATWDWNSPASAGSGSGNGAAGDGVGGDFGAPSCVEQASSSSSSAYWPNSYSAMGGFAQQAYNAQHQHYGMAPDGGVWLPPPPQQLPSVEYQSGYYAGYNGSNGVHHMHGSANSFTPRAPATSVNHYYQGWHNDNHFSAPTRGFATKAGSDDSSGKGPRRSKRLAAQEGQPAFGSPSPRNPFRSPSPRGGGGGGGKKTKGPPQPTPTAAYLTRASFPPARLPAPQPLLVIIDLNGTLVHRPSRKNSSRFISRPNVQPFLDYLLATHHVMIWSSARPQNVDKMCAQLFAPSPQHPRRAALKAEWGRDTLDLSPAQYNEKVQVYKVLAKVWRAAAAEGWFPPGTEGSFGQHNTLLVDDSVLKASAEPYNLVRVEEFEGREEQMRTDVLREVVGYLEEARWMTDVSGWVRSGEGRFEVGGRWSGYEWPEGVGAVDVGEVKQEQEVQQGVTW